MLPAAIATEFTARDDPALGPAARVYRLACAHGVSSALLMRGHRPLDDGVVLDFMLVGHHRSQGCGCEPIRSAAERGGSDA